MRGEGGAGRDVDNLLEARGDYPIAGAQAVTGAHRSHLNRSG